MLRARLQARSGTESLSPTAYKLMVALLTLVLIGLMACAALFFFRRVRRARREMELPYYEKSRPGSPISAHARNHRRLTINASKRPESVQIYQEKRGLVDSPGSPPDSPVPEIRITFPDEVDDSTGRRKSGGVVVVRVGETNYGLEPLREEQLPPYQCDTSERFQSLDLERIGGLKEREDKRWN